MPYVQLAIAIACEIGASSALKATHGFTVLAPSVATIVLYGLSSYLFSLVLNVLDLASAYATWCAAGIVATSVISVLVFGISSILPACDLCCAGVNAQRHPCFKTLR